VSEFDVRNPSFPVTSFRLSHASENVPVSEDDSMKWQISTAMTEYNTTGNGFLLRLRDHHASDDVYLNGTGPQ
jgi:hypothetical protein